MSKILFILAFIKFLNCWAAIHESYIFIWKDKPCNLLLVKFRWCPNCFLTQLMGFSSRCSKRSRKTKFLLVLDLVMLWVFSEVSKKWSSWIYCYGQKTQNCWYLTAVNFCVVVVTAVRMPSSICKLTDCPRLSQRVLNNALNFRERVKQVAIRPVKEVLGAIFC